MSIYELLLTAWKREKEVQNLLSLENNFYGKCRAYIQHLETQAKNETDDILVLIFNNRWGRVIYLMNDLVTIRLQKQFRDILKGVSSPAPIPDEEKILRMKFENYLSSYRDTVLGIQNYTEEVEIQNDNDKYKLVVFKQNESLQSIGGDLKKYGPFNIDDLAVIPAENMRNFLIRSKVEHVSLE